MGRRRVRGRVSRVSVAGVSCCARPVATRASSLCRGFAQGGLSRGGFTAATIEPDAYNLKSR